MKLKKILNQVLPCSVIGLYGIIIGLGLLGKIERDGITTSYASSLITNVVADAKNCSVDEVSSRFVDTQNYWKDIRENQWIIDNGITNPVMNAGQIYKFRYDPIYLERKSQRAR